MKYKYSCKAHTSFIQSHFRTILIILFLVLNADLSVAQKNAEDSIINQVAFAMRYEVRIRVDTGFFSTFMFPSETNGHKVNLSQALVDAVRNKEISAYDFFGDEILDSIEIEKSLGYYYDTIVYDPNDPPKCPKANIIVSRVADPASICMFELEYIVLYDDQKREIGRLWTGITLFKSEYTDDNILKGFRSCFSLKTGQPEVKKILEQSMSVADGFKCVAFSDTINHLIFKNYFYSSQFVSFAYIESVTGISLQVRKNESSVPAMIDNASKLVVREILIPYSGYPDYICSSAIENHFRNDMIDVDTFAFNPNGALFIDTYPTYIEYHLFRQVLLDEISDGRVQMFKNICLTETQSNGDLFCNTLSKNAAINLFWIYDSTIYNNHSLFSGEIECDTLIITPVCISRYEILELHTGDLIFPIAVSPGYAKYTNKGDFTEYKMIGWIPLSNRLMNTLNNFEAFNPGLSRQMTIAEYLMQHLYQGHVLSEHPINQQSWEIIREKFLQ